jgi:hypothetical protein
MNKNKKIFGLAAALAVFAAVSAFSQVPDLADLQKGVSDFSDAMAKSLPFNASLGLNWSDAYVGKFLPSVPPHFGAGGFFGFTTMQMPMINTLAGYLGYNIPFNMDKMFLPAYAAEGRLGGFFLPFDVGLKFGMLPEIDLWGTNLKTDYTMFGADVRYAVMEGNLVLPKISVGLGFNYLKGGIGAKVGNAQTFDVGPDTLVLAAPDLGLIWETKSLDVKAQISKSFIIVTPYAGVGASYAWSKAGYEVNTAVTYNGTPIDEPAKTAIANYLKGQNVEGVSVDENGISSIQNIEGFSARIFGGISFNVAVVKFDLSALYNVLDGNFGGSLGVRFQL